MKRGNGIIGRVAVLTVACVLLLVGLGLIFDVFRDMEQMVFSHVDHEQLLRMFRGAAVKIATGGALTAVALGTGLVLFLHLIRRTARIEKEAHALRLRNEAVEQLAHHQRLETIGMLTSSIAHEFNNLLTPIMGYSMMVLEKLGPEEEELYDDILEIYNASGKAKKIISRLSDLSRKNTGMTFRQVSPDELVKKTLDVANPARPLKVEVQMSLNCWDQQIRANEIQLSQMLLNLVMNAFHAMGDEPGVLTVETSFDERNVRLTVKDTGCGIPEEQKKRIFEPFFTTKEAGKGTGLGLAIVAQVVEDHQGHILLDSHEGEGTSVTVILPRNMSEQE